MKAIMKLEVIELEEASSNDKNKVIFQLTCGELKVADYSLNGKTLRYGTDTYQLSREVTGSTYENNSSGIFDLQNPVTLKYGDFWLSVPAATGFVMTQEPNQIQKNFYHIMNSLGSRCKLVSDWVKDMKANIKAAKIAVEFILGEE